MGTHHWNHEEKQVAQRQEVYQHQRPAALLPCWHDGCLHLNRDARKSQSKISKECDYGPRTASEVGPRHQMVEKWRKEPWAEVAPNDSVRLLVGVPDAKRQAQPVASSTSNTG